MVARLSISSITCMGAAFKTRMELTRRIQAGFQMITNYWFVRSVSRMDANPIVLNNFETSRACRSTSTQTGLGCFEGIDNFIWILYLA